MNLLPIAKREARLVASKRQTFHLRWVVAAAGAFFVAETLLSNGAWETLGQSLFFKLSLLGQCLAVFAGALHTADGFARERREGTLRLLFLTPLQPRDVTAGKFLASCASPLTTLVALLPLLAIPLLLGGVQPHRIALMSIHLLNTLFLSLAAGMLVSAQTSVSLNAITLSFLFAGALNFVPIGMGAMTANVYGPFDVFLDLTEIGSPVDFVGFFRVLLMANICSWIFLSLATRAAGKNRDAPSTISQEKAQRFGQTLRFGGQKQRARLRKKLLNQNPIAWLANRYQVSSFGLLMICFALLAAPVLVFGGAVPQFYYGQTIAQLLVALRMAAYATAQLSEDRESGALELLLSTPLTAREIVSGRARGFLRFFFGPCALLICAGIPGLYLALTASYGMPDESWRRVLIMGRIVGFAQTFAVWGAICWFGMWAGFRLRRQIPAVSLTLVLVLGSIILPPLLFRTRGGIAVSAAMFDLFFALYASSMMSIAILIAAAFLARRALTRTLRESAAAPTPMLRPA